MNKLFLLLFCIPVFAYAQPTPLLNAHAHNDYKHKHPLNDAMSCGFTSFEADVFLRHDSLIVAHISPFLKTGTLESLYLKPLYDSVLKYGGGAYSKFGHPVILLIDIKSDADKTYIALKKLLGKYAVILTRYNGYKLEERAITIILTGNKPYNLLKEEQVHLAFIDQSLMNVGSRATLNTCLLASTKYSNIFTWKGNGAVPINEEQQLIQLVTTAHAQGKKVRLWASPENKEVWEELLKCGVDLINTDELKKLRDFLLQRGI